MGLVDNRPADLKARRSPYRSYFLVCRIFFFHFFRNRVYLFPSCFRRRGVSRPSRDVGGGMRWAQRIAAWPRAARTNGSLRTAKSCGPDTPTLVSTHDEASLRVGMVANKPGAPGRPRISRSNRRAGKAGCFGQTCGDCRLLFFCRRATGAASARPSLRPPSVSRADLTHSSGARRRETAGARQPSRCRRPTDADQRLACQVRPLSCPRNPLLTAINRTLTNHRAKIAGWNVRVVVGCS